LAEGAGLAAIGGAEIASAALSAGLVDEYHLLIAPYVAGNGKAALPAGMSLRLELLDQTAFEGGMVYLRYRVEPGP
jgi:dihydrofolate reductase